MVKILAVLIAIAAGLAGWHFYLLKSHADPLASFSDRVKQAGSQTFGQLQFPDGVKDDYKANAAGQLIGLLNSCMTEGKEINALVRQENCAPLAVCVVNNTMKSLPPDQFTGKNRTKEGEDTAVKLFRDCLTRYRIKGGSNGR